VSPQIPQERRRVFARIAAASQTEKVLVVCRSRAVRRQYEAAVERLGGRLENVTFEVNRTLSKREARDG
jgi:hypothetical protein